MTGWQDRKASERDMQAIATACHEFEHVINAMGYGYSLLNVAPERYQRRCPDCIHWAGGSCDIFHRALAARQSAVYVE